MTPTSLSLSPVSHAEAQGRTWSLGRRFTAEAIVGLARDLLSASPIVFTLAIYVTLAVATIIVSALGLENINVLLVFDPDEHRLMTLMNKHLAEGNLNPHGFYIYGHFYDTIGYVILVALRKLGWLLETQVMGVTLRLLSLVSGLLAGAALVQLGRGVGLGAKLAALTSLLFVAMPDFVQYMRTIHPDTLQAFLVIASMAVALRRHSFGYALAAAFLAGLACGTKYSGLFVLPFCFAPYALASFGRERFGLRLVARLFVEGLSLVAVFVLAFAVTNPYAVRNFRWVIDDLVFMRGYVATGHHKVEPTDPSLWITPALSQFGTVGLALFATGGALIGAQIAAAIRSAGWRTLLSGAAVRSKLVLLVYVVITIAHLLLTVRIRDPRYAYHVLPFLIVLSVWGWSDAVHSLARRPVLARSVAVALMLVVAGIATGQAAHSLRNMASATRKPTDPMLAIGDYLNANVAPGTKILADLLTYIPPRFTAVDFIGGVGPQDVAASRPEVLILNGPMTGRVIWKAPGSLLKDRRFLRDPSYGPRLTDTEAFLESLLAETSPWRIVYETPQVVIFRKKEP